MVSDSVIQTIVQLVCVHLLDGLVYVNVTLLLITRYWNALLSTILLCCAGFFACLVFRCKWTHHNTFTCCPIYGSIGRLCQYTAIITRFAMVLHCTRSFIWVFRGCRKHCIRVVGTARLLLPWNTRKVLTSYILLPILLVFRPNTSTVICLVKYLHSLAFFDQTVFHVGRSVELFVFRASVLPHELVQF